MRAVPGDKRQAPRQWQIADYDLRRNGDRVVAPDRQLDVDKWGAVDTYGWSQEKARMVARRERDQLARFLRSKGFDLD